MDVRKTFKVDLTLKAFLKEPTMAGVMKLIAHADSKRLEEKLE